MAVLSHRIPRPIAALTLLTVAVVLATTPPAHAEPVCAARDYLLNMLARAETLAQAPNRRDARDKLRTQATGIEATRARDTLTPLMTTRDLRLLDRLLSDLQGTEGADGDATRAARIELMVELGELDCTQDAASDGIAQPAAENPYPGAGDTLAGQLAAPLIAFARRAAELLATPPMRLLSLILLSGSLAVVLIRRHGRLQRRHKRFRCTLPCTITTAGHRSEARLADISEEGCKVTSPLRAAKGTALDLAFAGHLVEARIAWSTTSAFGVRFATSLTEDEVARILRTSAAQTEGASTLPHAPAQG